MRPKERLGGMYTSKLFCSSLCLCHKLQLCFFVGWAISRCRSSPPHTHPIGGQGNTSCTLLNDHTLASHFWVVLWSMVLVTQCVCTWTNLHQKQQHLWSCVQYTLNFWNWTLKSSPEIQRHLLEQKSFNGFIPQESWCGTHLMRQPCLWEAKRSICSAR